MEKDKREIVFDMQSTCGTYRVVCRIGYDYTIPYAWWGHIQKQIEYKRFFFFGKTKTTWVEIDQCWWSKEFDSIADLKKSAEKFYDERVEMLPRVKNKALSLK